MKILAIGDMHIRNNHAREVNLMIDCVNDAVKSNQTDMIAILGDMHDTFSKIHLDALNLIDKFFNEIDKLGVPVKYIIGNHDAINNQCYLDDNHAFNCFKNKYNNIEIIDRVVEVDSIVFMPYVPVGRFSEALSNTDLSKVKVIFAHQEFKGCKMGAIESKHGDVWPEGAPIVISGHIHERSVLGKNILYVGSPYQTSFGDNSRKTLEVITIEGENIRTKPIETSMPKRVTVSTDIEGVSKIKMNDVDYYRVNISDSIANIHKFKKTKKFRDLQKIAKVVLKPTDNVIVKSVKEGKTFVSLLEDSIKKESESIQKEYQSVMSEVV